MVSLNIGSFASKFEDLLMYPVMKLGDVIFLCEIWLERCNTRDNYEKPDFKLFLDNAGKGRGTAVYVKNETKKIYQELMKM